MIHIVVFIQFIQVPAAKEADSIAELPSVLQRVGLCLSMIPVVRSCL